MHALALALLGVGLTLLLSLLGALLSVLFGGTKLPLLLDGLLAVWLDLLLLALLGIFKLIELPAWFALPTDSLDPVRLGTRGNIT